MTGCAWIPIDDTFSGRSLELARVRADAVMEVMYLNVPDRSRRVAGRQCMNDLIALERDLSCTDVRTASQFK